MRIWSTTDGFRLVELDEADREELKILGYGNIGNPAQEEVYTSIWKEFNRALSEFKENTYGTAPCLIRMEDFMAMMVGVRE